MKIVSLQSIGLGAIFNTKNKEPYIIRIGQNLNEGHDYGLDITITEINYRHSGGSLEYYEVHTSDGHTRMLPADKYIAELSEYSYARD